MYCKDRITEEIYDMLKIKILSSDDIKELLYNLFRNNQIEIIVQ